MESAYGRKGILSDPVNAKVLKTTTQEGDRPRKVSRTNRYELGAGVESPLAASLRLIAS